MKKKINLYEFVYLYNISKNKKKKNKLIINK